MSPAEQTVGTGIRWVEAATFDDIWEGDVLEVDLDGEVVLLVRLLDGGLRAYQGRCPHQEVALADGHWDPDFAELTCAGHHWKFDMDAGVGVNPAGCRLYRYPVEADGDTVRVGIPQDGLRHYNRSSGET